MKESKKEKAMSSIKIKTGDIVTAPWNARKEITPESVKDLAKSIKETGLINPITIWKSPEGKYVCIAGNRRLVALASLGVDEISTDTYCNLFSGSEAEARQVTITENLQREDVSVLEEAALVESLIGLGMTAHQIAAKIGRPESWVNRRKKLLALDKAWKDRADGMTADALERIAEYPNDVQESVAKRISHPVKTWNDVAAYFSREARDLNCAKFDTGECRACMQRTGQNTDLFGEVEDDGLGKCLCAKCFERKRKEYIDNVIAEATKGADEVVRVQLAWQLPNSGVKDRDAEHPCAYVFVYNDDVEVCWGESKKAKEEREAQERAEREAAYDEGDEKRKRLGDIINKLTGAFDVTSDEEENGARLALEQELRLRIEGKSNSETDMLVKFAMDALADGYSYRRDEKWAEICRALPFVPELAGVTAEELELLFTAYPEKEVME